MNCLLFVGAGAIAAADLRSYCCTTVLLYCLFCTAVLPVHVLLYCSRMYCCTAAVGFLVLRTASISAVYAVATGVVARGGSFPAAAHQVAFQLWLAASLLADSLAVASQTLVARAVAGGDHGRARKVCF
jgi:hypothetical protein